MRSNHIRVAGGFPTPYDVELLTTIGSKGCFGSPKLMLTRCMSIIHHFKEMTCNQAGLLTANNHLKQQVQDLLKDTERSSIDFPDVGDLSRSEYKQSSCGRGSNA